jgi:hypothetical protein
MGWVREVGVRDGMGERSGGVVFFGVEEVGGEERMGWRVGGPRYG